jgi:hypothetical protein
MSPSADPASAGSSSVFYGVFTAEESDGAGTRAEGDTTTVGVEILLEAFLNMSLRSVSLMKLFCGKKQNFRSWDYSPQVADYLDLQIIGRRIKGILLYIHRFQKCLNPCPRNLSAFV